MFEFGKIKIENYNKTTRQLMFELGKIKIKKTIDNKIINVWIGKNKN